MGKYLLSVPGVDVDFRNDAGKTTLLVLVSEANRNRADKKNPLSAALVADVKELVETRGADATAVDHEGKGAMHYLCTYDTKPTQGEEDRGDDEEEAPTSKAIGG